MTDIFAHGDDDPAGEDQETRPRGKRRRSKVAIAFLTAGALLLAVIVAVAVIGGVYVGNLASSFNSKTQKITSAFPSDRATATTNGSENILLMGSDSRAASTSATSTSASDQRSDTMMLVHVDADRKAVYVMSIMRDLWVPIPGHGTHKINAAFAYGGSALTVQTIEQLLGVRIDHVAIIDFQGFEGMTDALGGVDVNSDYDFTGRGTHFVKGINHLDGADALKFVRERYSFANGDYQRVKDQQAFLRAIVDRLISRSTLTSPSKITNFVNAMSSYLSVDDTLTASTVAKLGFSLRSVGKDDVHFFTIPTGGTGTADDGESIVLVNDQAMPDLKTAIANDTLGSYPPASGK